MTKWIIAGCIITLAIVGAVVLGHRPAYAQDCYTVSQLAKDTSVLAEVEFAGEHSDGAIYVLAPNGAIYSALFKGDCVVGAPYAVDMGKAQEPVPGDTTQPKRDGRL